MKACYLDIHIHTSEDANNLNNDFDVKTLKEKIVGCAKGNNYLISLTDHNTINQNAYEKMIDEGINFIVGVELHVKNYDNCPAYHCHFFFKTTENVLDEIAALNNILDELYPNKLPELKDVTIPHLSKIIKKLEGFEYLILPHGGQSHSAFNTSIPRTGVCFNDVMERSVYYNLFDGFTSRSNNGLEITQEYFKKLGIAEFINLVTCTDNYSIKDYPKGKGKGEFIPTWMYSTPSFDGLRVALSENTRLSYGNSPNDNWQEQIKSVNLKEENIEINVNLEPGLNVVIGNSSSGKTLFVDSLYKKIKDETTTSYSKFNVENIIVDNPSGITPHYFSQNYILSLVQKDEEKGIDNNLSDNEFLKQIFPFDKEFEEKINSGINELRSQLTLFVNSAKNIKEYQVKISNIPSFSRLFYLGDKQINPIKTLLPIEKEKQSLNITSTKKNEVEKYLDEIKAFQSSVAFCESVDEEINSIKNKLKRAYEEIDFANKINTIISDESKAIDNELVETNQKNMTIDGNKSKLLDYTKLLIENYDSFWRAYGKLVNFTLSIETKTIKSAGHSLSIKNNFKITKNILIESLNKYLKEKIEPDKLKVNQLFDDNFRRQSPKAANYDDLIEKIMKDFNEQNKVVYEIIHKDGRKFSELSPGLRTSVILDIILGYDSDQAPLIIDQPEDNLATNYINTDLVSAIKKSKVKRQIIIVTHNATIPMLGDAQTIVYCCNEGDKIVIKSYKMEDQLDSDNSILDVIANVTDGGKASVKKRFKKYNLKNYR